MEGNASKLKGVVKAWLVSKFRVKIEWIEGIGTSGMHG